MKHRSVRWSGVFLAILLLITGLGIPASIAAAPDEGGRVPYQFNIDDLNGKGVGGTMIGVIRDLHLPLGQSITASGWLATDEGVSAYQYLWIPTGGGYAEWKTVEKVTITDRGDLAAHGIPYASGHGSAGFSLTVDPPMGLAEGVYDVYIRALDGMGTPCDMAALLNLRYGDPDIDDGKTHTVCFPRIQREGAASAVGNAIITATDVTLSSEGRIKLGELNLAAFEQLRITYTADNVDAGVGDGRRPILGLKSSGDHGYGQAGDSYNMTDNLLYAAIDPATGAGMLEIDLTDCTYYGDVWLTGYVGGEIQVTEIEFVYNGYATDRVAAKIHLSGDLVGGYFSSQNYTTAMGVTDPVLGDVLRLEAKEETNDPYIHFNVGKLLAENEIVLDADEYKYLVFLYRASENNNSERMNLYLCSGPITGATEACNQSVTLRKDGKWHYLLVDLSQKENWGGIINGWRFDYISADSDPGDAVDFATVQFFRTLEGAQKAASQDPGGQQPYRSGDPAIIRDLSEENEGTKEDYIINPDDVYIITEPETEAPTEPETAPADTSLSSDTETAESPDQAEETQSTVAKKGCASHISILFTGILPVAMIPMLQKRKAKRNMKDQEALPL
ncbi:MAG: hypothetical protein IJX72_02855 [Clostridia bacterium]|nr:hypothetical protein [Clostridia bacterium]